MKKILSIGVLGFLFLLSCGNQDRNEEYQCIFSDNSGSIFLKITNKKVQTQLTTSKYKLDNDINFEDKDKIVFLSYPHLDKLQV